jgi:hypothetical protein
MYLLLLPYFNEILLTDILATLLQNDDCANRTKPRDMKICSLLSVLF